MFLRILILLILSTNLVSIYGAVPLNTTLYNELTLETYPQNLNSGFAIVSNRVLNIPSSSSTVTLYGTNQFWRCNVSSNITIVSPDLKNDVVYWLKLTNNTSTINFPGSWRWLDSDSVTTAHTMTNGEYVVRVQKSDGYTNAWMEVSPRRYVVNGNYTNIFTNIVYVNNLTTEAASWAALTNAAKTSPVGSLIVVGPGVYRGSNAWPLNVPGKNFYFQNSQIIQNSTLVQVPLFGDTDGNTITDTTNIISGTAKFITTNNAVCSVIGSASKIWISFFSANVYDGGGLAIECFTQLAGELHIFMLGNNEGDESGSQNYDFYYNGEGTGGSTRPAKTTIVASRIYAGDSALEFAVGYTNASDVHVDIGTAIALSPLVDYGGSFISLHSNIHARVDKIIFKNQAAYIGSYLTNHNLSGLNSSLSGNLLIAAPNATNSPIYGLNGQGTAFTLEGYHIIGPTNIDPITADTGPGYLKLRNITIEPGFGATNWIRSKGTSSRIIIEGNIGINPYLSKASSVSIVKGSTNLSVGNILDFARVSRLEAYDAFITNLLVSQDATFDASIFVGANFSVAGTIDDGSTNIIDGLTQIPSIASGDKFLVLDVSGPNLAWVSYSTLLPTLITNLSNIKYSIHRNSTITMSNLVVSFNTNTHEVIGQTNMVLTNLVGISDTINASTKVFIKPSGVNMTLIYPSFKTPINGYYWYTNINSPMWTTATNGVVYVLSLEAIGTNIFSTLTPWP